MSKLRTKGSPAGNIPRISYTVPLTKARKKSQVHVLEVEATPPSIPANEPSTPVNSPKTKGCHLCDWKGIETFAEGEFADIRYCTCQEETCKICRGVGGYEVELKSGNVAWKTCECQQLVRRMELFRRAKIPSRFADKTLNAFAPNDETQMRVRAHLYKLFQDSPSSPAFKPGDSGILLMGPPGVGKTHLMVGLIRYLMLERGIPCLFQDFGLLLSNLRDAYSRDISEMKVLNPLIRVDVLLLDDLAKGRNSKWELGIIDTLVSCRYNAGKTTLLTTNYTEQPETTLRERFRGRGANEGEELMLRDTLVERVGDRIHSRLREMCVFFRVAGADYRQKNSGKG